MVGCKEKNMNTNTYHLLSPSSVCSNELYVSRDIFSFNLWGSVVIHIFSEKIT